MSHARRRLLLAVKTAVAVAIVVGVSVHFGRILNNRDFRLVYLPLRVEYLVPAGLLYLVAHTFWATFWFRLLRFEGEKVSWLAAVRAYFVSQFGKYVPGKAWVILLRIVLLRRYHTSRVVVGVTATYETLTNMAAGALIGAVLLPWAGIKFAYDSWPMAALAGAAGLPIVLAVLNKMTVRLTAGKRGPDARPLPNPTLLLLAQGLLQAAAGWCLLGLSLWLTVQAVSPEPAPLTLDDFLRDTAAVGLSYVVGFVVLVAPGGLGARELLLQRVLAVQLAATMTPQAAGTLAVVIALLLRLVWTAAEVAVAAGFYWHDHRAAGRGH